MEEVVTDLWHIYSYGTRADIPFATDEEKTFAWNSVAICAEIAGVTVLVSTVLDTDVYIMIRGEEAEAKHFIVALKQRLARRYGRMNFTAVKIHDRKEAMVRFMQVYCYCLDFFPAIPQDYPWGSGHIYFSDLRIHYACIRLGDFSLREQYRQLGTRKLLPPAWLLDADGRIIPESFIDYLYAEQLFRDAWTFLKYYAGDKE